MGIIGTGSTACQIVGAITEKVDEMVVFQRTPQWMAPLPQTEYSAGWNRMMGAFPFMQKLAYHFYLQKMVSYTYWTYWCWPPVSTLVHLSYLPVSPGKTALTLNNAGTALLAHIAPYRYQVFPTSGCWKDPPGQ